MKDVADGQNSGKDEQVQDSAKGDAELCIRATWEGWKGGVWTLYSPRWSVC